MISHRVLSVLALSALAACSSSEKENEHPEASGAPSGTAAPSGRAMAHRPTTTASGATSAAPATTTTASAAPSGSPAAGGASWEAGLSKPVTEKPGARVWALAPAGGEKGLFSVVEIESVQGNSAATLSLIKSGDKLAKDAGAKHVGTPGALIWPAASIKDAKIKKGEIVIAMLPDYHTTAAHVVKLKDKDEAAEVKYAHGDKVKDETVTYAVPLATGIAPFAYVAAKKGSSYQEILVAGVVGDEVYGVDEAGAVVKVAKADVKPLAIEWKDRKKCEKVTVFENNTSVETTIDTVSVEKWVYAVKVNGAEKRVPFYAVVDKL
jgi:hypothetical protein